MGMLLFHHPLHPHAPISMLPALVWASADACLAPLCAPSRNSTCKKHLCKEWGVVFSLSALVAHPTRGSDGDGTEAWKCIRVPELLTAGIKMQWSCALSFPQGSWRLFSCSTLSSLIPYASIPWSLNILICLGGSFTMVSPDIKQHC